MAGFKKKNCKSAGAFALTPLTQEEVKGEMENGVPPSERHMFAFFWHKAGFNLSPSQSLCSL